MKILVADPAKNITVFVLDPVEGATDRASIARAILADKSLGAEQVGFVVPPEGASAGAVIGSGSRHGLWHLEMMGGEFCGNAARSFGLYAARKQGLRGKAEVFISVSGADGPVQVEVDIEKGRAAAEMPKPQALKTLDYKGSPLPALIFEGITHIIAPGTPATAQTGGGSPPGFEANAEVFYAIKVLAEKQLFPPGEDLPAALGVMFYDAAAGFLRPAVYVRSTDTLVFESSCGSGCAALGAWLSRELRDGTVQYILSQSGGVIETEVFKKAGEIVRLTIGGEVKLGEQMEYEPYS